MRHSIKDYWRSGQETGFGTGRFVDVQTRRSPGRKMFSGKILDAFDLRPRRPANSIVPDKVALEEEELGGKHSVPIATTNQATAGTICHTIRLMSLTYNYVGNFCASGVSDPQLHRFHPGIRRSQGMSTARPIATDADLVFLGPNDPASSRGPQRLQRDAAQLADEATPDAIAVWLLSSAKH